MSGQSTKAMGQELKAMVADEAVQKGVRKVVDELEVFDVRKNGTLTSRAQANGTGRSTRAKSRATNA